MEHRVKEVVISDEVMEAIYDAIDMFGVYEFSLDNNIRNVIYVLGIAEESLPRMIQAQDYLNDRCPEFYWVAGLCCWDVVPSGDLLYISSLWYWEGMDL